MRSELAELVLQHDELAELSPAQRRLALRELFGLHLSGDDLSVAVAEAADEIDGWGPLTVVMSDPEVTDVLVNGPGDVWIERGGQMARTAVSFEPNQLRSFIDRLVGGAGGRVDPSAPIADARLQDGSRLHVVLPPLAPNGPLVSIRRFPSTPFSIDDLLQRRMVSEGQATTLRTAVRERRTILISGATGSGKTTLLNALLGAVPAEERVVLIEETPELRPTCAHAVSLVARRANVAGEGAVGLEELVRAALRMRPDRIVVGEVRGAEAMVALSALSTGHSGSLLTIHARSAPEASDRFVALAMEARTRSTEDAIRARAKAAFDVCVHLEHRAGERKVTDIIES